MKELFNNGKIRVRTNGSGEIFVERIGGITLRIGDVGHWPTGLSLTADNAVYHPTSFNGLGGFIIR